MKIGWRQIAALKTAKQNPTAELSSHSACWRSSMAMPTRPPMSAPSPGCPAVILSCLSSTKLKSSEWKLRELQGSPKTKSRETAYTIQRYRVTICCSRKGKLTRAWLPYADTNAQINFETGRSSCSCKPRYNMIHWLEYKVKFKLEGKCSSLAGRVIKCCNTLPGLVIDLSSFWFFKTRLAIFQKA